MREGSTLATGAYAGALEAIEQDGEALKNVSSELRDNREIVLAAVDQNPFALQYASDRIKNDREVVLRAVEGSGEVLQCASKSLRNDREIVLAAVRQDGWALTYASKALRGDPDILLAAVCQNANALKFADSSLKTDRELMLQAVSHHGQALEYTTAALRGNRKFAMAAAKIRASSLKFVGSSLLADRAFVFEAVRTNPSCLPHAPESLINDTEFLLEAITLNPSVLCHVSDELRCSKAFVSSAVSFNGDALAYAALELQRDPEVISKALRQNGSALRFVPNDVDDYRCLVLSAIQQDESALKFASAEMKDDRDIALSAVTRDGCLLEHLSPAMRDDRDVVLRAIESSWKALDVAGKVMKADRDIVLAAVKQSGKALAFASSSLRNDPDFVLLAMDYDQIALHHSDLSLQTSRAFLKAALERDGTVWGVLPEQFVNDVELADIAMQQNGLTLEVITEQLSKVESSVAEAICDMVFPDQAFNPQETQYLSSLGDCVSELHANYERLCTSAVCQNGLAIIFVNPCYLDPEDDLPTSYLASTGRQKSVDRYSNSEAYRRIAISALVQNTKAMQYLPDVLTSNETFILSAIERAGASALEYASPRMLQSSSFSQKAGLVDEETIKYFGIQSQALSTTDSTDTASAAKSYRWNIAAPIATTHPESLGKLRSPLTRDRAYLIKSIETNAACIKYVPEALENREFLMEAIAKNGDILQYVPETIASDADFIILALTVNAASAPHVSTLLKSSRNFALSVVSLRGEFLGILSSELQADPDVVGRAIDQSGDALEFVSPSIANYRSYVLAAVRKSGSAIQFAVGLRNDRDVANAAISSESRALSLIGEELQSSRVFILRAVVRNPDAIAYVKQCFVEDRGFIEDALMQNGLVWNFIPKQHQFDFELALIAVSSNGSVILHITTMLMGRLRPLSNAFAKLRWRNSTDGKSALRNRYEELCRAAVKQSIDVLGYVSTALLNDAAYARVALIAIVRDINAMKLIPKTLSSDRLFLLAALKAVGNASILRFANPHLLASYSFMSDAVTIDGFALKYSVGVSTNNADVPGAETRSGSHRSFLEDRELVLKAVRKKGCSIKFASKTLLQDRDVASCAVGQDGSALKFLHDSLRGDYDIVKLAVTQYGGALEWANRKLRGEPSIVLSAINKSRGHAMQHAAQALRSDASFMLIAFQTSSVEALEYATPKLLSDLSFAKDAVKLDGTAFKFFSAELKGNPDIALTAIKNNPKAFSLAAPSLAHDRFFVLAAVDVDGLVLKYVPDALRNDNEVCKVALESNGSALEFVPEAMRKDRNLVRVALMNDPDALAHCASVIKMDHELVSTAVQMRGTALRHCPTMMWFIRDIVTLAVCQDWRTVSHGPSFVSRDAALMRIAAIQNPQALKYAHNELLMDKDFISSVVKSQGYALRYASDDIKRDPALVASAINGTPLAIKYASDCLKRDPGLVALAVKGDSWALIHTTDAMRNDLSIGLVALVGDVNALEHLGDDLKSDAEVMQVARTVKFGDRRIAALYLAANRGAVHALRSLIIGEPDARDLVVQRIKGGTLLHHAASKGQVRACRVLVEECHTPLLSRDSGGKIALSLAEQNEHTDVLEYFASLRSVLGLSGGDGCALQEALDDPRPITRVEWRVRQLPQWTAGARQSLLVLTVGEATDVSKRLYTVEKAFTQSFPKGVLVSQFMSNCMEDWIPWGHDDSSQADVSSSEITSGITMGELYFLATDKTQTEYDILCANCHHLAQHVFNSITAESISKELPEDWGISFATRVPHSTSRLVASFGAGNFPNKNPSIKQRLRRAATLPVNKRADQSKSTKCFRGESNRTDHPFPAVGEICPNERHQWVDKTVVLSQWIKDCDPSLFSITSKLSFKVELVVNGTETARCEIAPGETKLIPVTKAFVDAPSVSGSAQDVLQHFKSSTAEIIIEVPNPKCADKPLYEVHDERVQAGATHVLQHCCEHGRIIECDMLSVSRLPFDVELCGTVNHGPNGVSWAIAKQGSDTAFVIFNGDTGPFQVEADIGSEPIAVPSDGSCLQAHGSLWNSLQAKPALSVSITRELEAHALSGIANLVFCGYSMGGAYALLCALEFLLHDGVDRVSAVHCFGSPQVLCCPPLESAERPLWDELNRITTVYVNEWDCVPRLPSCTAWINSVMLSSEVLATTNFSRARVDAMKHNMESLSTYRPLGTVMIIGVGRESAMCLQAGDREGAGRTCPSTSESCIGNMYDDTIAQHWLEDSPRASPQGNGGSDESYNWLNICPGFSGDFVVTQHAISEYVAAVRSLKCSAFGVPSGDDDLSVSARESRPRHTSRLLGRWRSNKGRNNVRETADTETVELDSSETTRITPRDSAFGRFKRRLKNGKR